MESNLKYKVFIQYTSDKHGATDVLFYSTLKSAKKEFYYYKNVKKVFWIYIWNNKKLDSVLSYKQKSPKEIEQESAK